MISVAIFTLNEEVNLPHCLASLEACNDIVVVDSGSQDKTCEIAIQKKCRVFEHPFSGFGDQRMWAMSHIEFQNPWLLVLDADERVTPELWNEMCDRTVTCSSETAAFQLKRRFFWEGNWLRYSNLYPSWVVRLIRMGRVKYINRGHAETQEVDGRIESLNEDLIDENHKGVKFWHERQKKYAEQEAAYEASMQVPLVISDLLKNDPLKRRAAMKQMARYIPFRGWMYFFYVYFLRWGFLDGWTGLRFCLAKAKYQNLIQSITTQLKKSV
jgi:glycosyltransferase involved in cell wall biosynthesis